jgi:hypothetical protein
MADSTQAMPDQPSRNSSDSSIDDDEGGPIYISVGDEVRYFFMGKFGDKSSLRTSNIKSIDVKYCNILEGQTVHLFLVDNYLIQFPSQFLPLLDGEPLSCGFISCEDPRIKVVERGEVIMKAVDGCMNQLRRSIDNIRQAANSLGYSNHAITESLDTTSKAEDQPVDTKIYKNTQSMSFELGSEDALLDQKPPASTLMDQNLPVAKAKSSSLKGHCLDGDHVFPNWMSIKKHMEGYANLRNFRISVSPKEYFDLKAQETSILGLFLLFATIRKQRERSSLSLPSLLSLEQEEAACITCRDLHNQPLHISQGHRSGSTKCPYYKKPSSLVQENVIGNNVTQEIGEDTKFVNTPAGATTYSYPSL